MKIGQQNIDRAKAITRRNEDRGFAAERLDRAVLGGSTFQQPQRGGADRDDAATLRARRIERVGGFAGDHTPFRMHLVSGGIVRLDRQERPGPDMQREPV